jgi:hypothetical protein
MIKKRIIINLNHNLIIKGLIFKDHLLQIKINKIHIQDNSTNTQIFLQLISFLKTNNLKIQILFHKNLSIKIKTNLISKIKSINNSINKKINLTYYAINNNLTSMISLVIHKKN